MASKRRADKSVFGAKERSVALLWGSRERSARGPKPALTIDAIAREAIDIADREGLSAVSMQRLASALGVTPMALYRYVPGKAELVDLMIDLALPPPPPLEGDDWRAKMEAWARALYAQFAARPWALEATGRLRHMGPNELAWLESGLAILEETGLEGAELVDSLLAVNVHVRGLAPFGARAADRPAAITREDWSTGVRALLETRGERYPAIARAMGAKGFSSGDVFGFGLECVLDGIASFVAKPNPAKKRKSPLGGVSPRARAAPRSGRRRAR